MGYETRYKWSIKPDTQEVRDWLILRQTKDRNFAYGISPKSYSTQACKWYDHDQDMLEFSKVFPKVLFTLEGEGEEGGDLWKAYYKNGKQQTCPAKITSIKDKFDKSKLR
jgi:hypothetical protein